MANNHFQNKARAGLFSLRALARRASRKSNARPRHAHYAVVPPDPLALVLHDRQGTPILVQVSVEALHPREGDGHSCTMALPLVSVEPHPSRYTEPTQVRKTPSYARENDLKVPA